MFPEVQLISHDRFFLYYNFVNITVLFEQYSPYSTDLITDYGLPILVYLQLLHTLLSDCTLLKLHRSNLTCHLTKLCTEPHLNLI